MSASRSRVLVWRSLICSISIVSSSCRIYPCTLHAPQRNARRFSRKVLRVGHRSPAVAFTHRETLQGYSRLLDSMRIPNLNRGQDTCANRTDTQRAQAHNHTQNSNSRTQPDKPHVHTHTHTSRGERCQSTVWWWGSCVNLERPPPASRYHLGLAQGSKDSESSREATKSPRCFCLLKPLFDRDCLTVYAKIIYRSTMDPTRTDRKA